MSDSVQQAPVSDDSGDAMSTLESMADANPPARVWETVFADTGEQVEWLPGTGSKRDGTFKPGTIMEGKYMGAEMVTLPEEKRLESEDPDKEEAPLLIFEDEFGDNWSTWETYQIKADKFKVGDWYRIECQRERKVGRGHMKSFKIQRDSNGINH